MSLKALTADQCYKSFKAYELRIDKEVKEGKMSNQQAKALLASAKKNYSKQNYNRELEKIKCA